MLRHRWPALLAAALALVFRAQGNFIVSTEGDGAAAFNSSASQSFGPLSPVFGYFGLQEGSIDNVTLVVWTGEMSQAYCSFVDRFEATGDLPDAQHPLSIELKDSLVVRLPGVSPLEADEECRSNTFRSYAFHPCMLFPSAIFTRLHESDHTLGYFGNAFGAAGDTGFRFERYNAILPAGCAYLEFEHTAASREILQKAQSSNVVGTLTISPNEYLEYMSLPVVQIVFSYLFPIAYLFVVAFALLYANRRRCAEGHGLYEVQSAILIINACSLSIIAVHLFIDGYGVRAAYEENIRNTIMGLNFGSLLAGNVLLSGIWGRINRRAKLFKFGISGQFRMWITFLALALIILDYVSVVLIYVSATHSLQIASIFSSIFAVLQLFVGAYLVRSTYGALRLLRERAVEKERTVSSQQVVYLIKRLAFWIRVAIACSIFNVIFLAFHGFHLVFSRSPAETIAFNAIFLLSRLGASLAQIMTCKPPRKKEKIKRKLDEQLAQNQATSLAAYHTSLDPSTEI